MAAGTEQDFEAFIAYWSASEGAERANYVLFLNKLCELLGVETPQASRADTRFDDYVFERGVLDRGADAGPRKRIDLYKRGCFVLEAKQSRLKDRPKAVIDAPEQNDMFGARPQGKRSASRQWDVLMRNARQQAEEYAWRVAREHGWPPFLIVCDVGHCFEIYADFSGQGRNYAQFPDRRSYRIYLEDLRNEKTRQLLRDIWSEPAKLDRTRESAKVTREIAQRLAKVSRALEAHHPAEEVALFLMRCLFTMFAEDVKLLPEKSFTKLLQQCEESPQSFAGLLSELWRAMDRGGFSAAIAADVKHFNGALFKDAKVFAVPKEEIGELLAAAKADWREVEPAIFGTLLEQALDAKERSRLGAHYTPRPYVERLVIPTIIEPLREDWAAVQAVAEDYKSAGELKKAQAEVKAFHDQLCATRVLDPACGTGNFLYVAMELMKKLEGEVLEAYADLGGQEDLIGLGAHTIDPHQFLGLELNPRAAAIAELVLWIGYLQSLLRTTGAESETLIEPVLKEFKNINFGRHGGYDAVLAHDGIEVVANKKGQRVEQLKNPRRPEWPEAEFIVGNPPFIGGKDIRSRQGDAYAEALWVAHKKIGNSADYVMYWWDRAADIAARKDSILRRFGLVTTNSITQEFSRRVIKKWRDHDPPISLHYAIPDHPWTKQTQDAAAVRIAMTVAAQGAHAGVLREVTYESGLDTDTPLIRLSERCGAINPRLSVGLDLSFAKSLWSNTGICSRGMSLHGDGFIVTPAEAEVLGLGRRPGLERYIKPYRNGRDLTARPRKVMVIDLFGLDADQVRREFPEVHSHLLATVKKDREEQYAKSPTADSLQYLEAWWLFGKPRPELREALLGLNRYAATVESAKHRLFPFVSVSTLPDNKLVCVAIQDAVHFGVLQSATHRTWYLANAGMLGVYDREAVYVKTRCFDPFPFPVTPPPLLRKRIERVAEDLDAHRKRVQAEHPDITLTDMYNALEAVRAGRALDEDETRIRDQAAILTLKSYHDDLDRLVIEAYGWSADITDEQILEKLVALNAERAAEEARGDVKWLRPDYQIPRFAKKIGAPVQIEAELEVAAEKKKPSFPAAPAARTAAVMSAFLSIAGAASAADIAKCFKQGRQVEAPIKRTLRALARMGFLTTDDGGATFSANQSGGERGR